MYHEKIFSNVTKTSSQKSPNRHLVNQLRLNHKPTQPLPPCHESGQPNRHLVNHTSPHNDKPKHLQLPHHHNRQPNRKIHISNTPFQESQSRLPMNQSCLNHKPKNRQLPCHEHEQPNRNIGINPASQTSLLPCHQAISICLGNWATLASSTKSPNRHLVNHTLSQPQINSLSTPAS